MTGRLLQHARTTLRQAQKDTQDAFAVYTASIEAERRAWQAVAAEEDRRDGLVSVILRQKPQFGMLVKRSHLKHYQLTAHTYSQIPTRARNLSHQTANCHVTPSTSQDPIMLIVLGAPAPRTTARPCAPHTRGIPNDMNTLNRLLAPPLHRARIRVLVCQNEWQHIILRLNANMLAIGTMRFVYSACSLTCCYAQF